MDTRIKLKGDKVIAQIPSIKDKALRINLNENIYGTFAEIGAGQETVRHFLDQVDLPNHCKSNVCLRQRL